MGPWLPAILNFRICCKFMTQFGWFARVCLLADSVTQTASRAHKGVTGLTSQPSAHLYCSIFDWDKHRLITGLHCTWKPEQFGKGGGGVLPIRTFFLGCYFPSENLKKSCQDNSGHFTTYKKICESSLIPFIGGGLPPYGRWPCSFAGGLVILTKDVRRGRGSM